MELNKKTRLPGVPMLHTRGTYYQVGFNIGHTFGGLIREFIEDFSCLKDYISAYETEEGKTKYLETLASCKKNFPQYVRELQGMAEGAEVPFYKLFLLNMDDIIMPEKMPSRNGAILGAGCSSVCCNQKGAELLGHTEDALAPLLNYWYLVSAHIQEEDGQGRWRTREERFTSLCYAGYLPGFAMSYNHHGLVYSINIIQAEKLVPGKTPRLFLARALLATSNLAQAQEVLSDRGCGAAEAFSVNMTFLKQEGDRLFHNAEVGPDIEGALESSLSILTASPGETIYHCNKYLRLNLPPSVDRRIIVSSDRRHAAMNKLPKPLRKEDVLAILGDQSDDDFPIFRDNGYVVTLAAGVFDCIEKTWSIYTDNPKTSEPAVVLPLILK